MVVNILTNIQVVDLIVRLITVDCLEMDLPRVEIPIFSREPLSIALHQVEDKLAAFFCIDLNKIFKLILDQFVVIMLFFETCFSR
jgi:hypothetical protein